MTKNISIQICYKFGFNILKLSLTSYRTVHTQAWMTECILCCVNISYSNAIHKTGAEKIKSTISADSSFQTLHYQQWNTDIQCTSQDITVVKNTE